MNLVEPDILVDDWFFGSGAIYRAISGAVGGLGEEMHFRGTGGFLVA